VKENYELTVVMPCLNEADTLAACIRKAQQGLAAAGANGEILVADNGSTDGSVEIARQLGARVVEVKEKGYGNALNGGIRAAQGKWIIMGDADDSYDFSEIAPFVERLREGYEMVMGCRLPAGGGAFVAGLALLAVAVAQWWATGFGHLDYARTMRWVIPGVTLTALGFQTILASFFVSILGMKKPR
jgi:glycosyltransferase involved in cell wall biosynthesis